MPTALLVLIVTFCTIGSQLLLKSAIVRLVPVLQQEGVFQFIFAALTSPRVVTAIGIQGVGYVVWFFVLAQERLSIAFALSGSFFYLTMAVASWYLFDERLGVQQWAALVLISVGVLLLHVGNGS